MSANIHYPLFIQDSIPSTNAALKELIPSKPAPFTVIQANFQTAGRGQMGNHWESEPGKNLLFSVLLKPKSLQAKDQFILSKAISIALIHTLKHIVPEIKIKWPNDIYVGDNKLAGILIENILQQVYIGYSIAGIGLNINQIQFKSNAPNPISLKQITGTDQNIAAIRDSFVLHLQQTIEQIDNNHWQALHDEYLQHLYRKEGFHNFKDNKGAFLAQISGISPEGFLQLKDSHQKSRSYAFKEVTFL